MVIGADYLAYELGNTIHTYAAEPLTDVIDAVCRDGSTDKEIANAEHTSAKRKRTQWKHQYGRTDIKEIVAVSQAISIDNTQDGFPYEE